MRSFFSALVFLCCVRIAAYDIDNQYVPNAFPKQIDRLTFSLPLTPESLRIACPPAAQPAAALFQENLAKKTGRRTPLEVVTAANVENLKSSNLILVGNMTDNPLMLELYRKRYAFYDAVLPGVGGEAVHCVPSPWRAGRRLLLVGVNGPGDLVPAFDGLLARIPEGAVEIPYLRSWRSTLQFPAPPTPAELKKKFDDILNNLYGSMAPYFDIAGWALTYHLTGDTNYARCFRDGIYLLLERGKRAGEWIPESWTLSYFAYSRWVMAWRLMEWDPFFTVKDREIITEVLYGYAKFIQRVPYLKDEWCPPGELRQNHTTFLGLSQFFARSYFHERFGLSEFDDMIPYYQRAFAGQAAGFRPNDDAGGGVYVPLAPVYTHAYLMATGDSANLKSGQQARTADLIVAITDNLRQPVSFGDVGKYSPSKSGYFIRKLEDNILSTAAWFAKDGQFQWVHRWKGDSGQASIENIALGLYASGVPAAEPRRFLGVFPVPADEAVVRWSALRSFRPSEIARSVRTYLDKLSFRAAFDPEREYLLLDGLSTFAHGHMDGNTVCRLTWKKRIWLFDLDYIKTTPRYHNGLMVVKDGICEDVPPLTELAYHLDTDYFGFSGTRVTAYNGADWTRHIVWKKGAYFLFLDQVKAAVAGDFRLTSRWRTRGQVNLFGNLLSAVQGDAGLTILSADDAAKELESEPDHPKHDWSEYPYGTAPEAAAKAGNAGAGFWNQDKYNTGEILTLKGAKSLQLAPGQSYCFSNLMWVASNRSPSNFTIKRAGENAWLVGGGGAVLAGVGGAFLSRAGFQVQCDLFLLTDHDVTFLNLSSFRSPKTSLTFDKPVSRRFSLKDSKMAGLGEAFKQAALSAAEVLPEPRPAPFVDFGLDAAGTLEFPAKVTAVADGNGFAAAGNAKGEVFLLEKDTAKRIFQLDSAKPVVYLSLRDIDGDGAPEILTGDQGETLHCRRLSGEKLWQLKLVPNYNNAMVSGIEVATLGKDREKTILAATNGWKLYGIRPDGQVKFETFIKYHMLTQVKVLNDSARGTPLIVVGNEYSTPVNVLSGDGKLLWHVWEQVGSESKSKTDYLGFHLTDMLFMDADGDGKKEIVFGTKYNRIYGVDAGDGSLRFTANAGDEVNVLKEFNGGFAAGTAGGDLISYTRRGRRRGTLFFGSPVVDLASFNLKGRSRNDLAVLLKDGRVAVVDSALTLRGHFNTAVEAPLKMVLLPGPEPSVFLQVVGQNRAVALRYAPHFRRLSRFY